MIINADVKGLEIVCAAEHYNDLVLKDEILSGANIHLNNQQAFGLPTRLVAKVLKFRTIYGGGAWSFAHDPDFMPVSTSEKYWQGVLDAYFEKYKGIAQGHIRDTELAMKQGYIEILSGRYFRYRPTNGKWPLTTIKNYPIQGLGADLVMLARIEFYRLLEESGLEALFIGTVHDSLKVDTPEENCYTISKMLKDSIEAIPALCKEHWNYSFSLPVTCEIKVGPNQHDMVEINI
jgi:DNA polymerase I-like protein with 3'-5' exonuclease and polymerase domains